MNESKIMQVFLTTAYMLWSTKTNTD